MRRREYDVVRGLAVIFMIAVHILLTVYDGGSAVVYKAVDFLGSAPTAPVFMFLLGSNALTSRHNEPRQLFRRGLKLFLASYVFNAVCHALPAGIAGFTHPTPGWINTVCAWLFAVDILTFAGMMFMVFGVIRKLKVSPIAFLVISMMLHAVGNSLNAACPITFENNMFGAGFLSLYYNASIPGYFSLFTWMVYPAAGFFFADVLRRAADEELVWRKVGIGAGIVFAAMLAAFCLLPSVHNPYYEDEYVYYRNGYFLLIHNLAFIGAWLALWHVLCRRFTGLGTGLFLIWSRNLTKIFVIQWFLIGAFFIAPFGETLKLGLCAYLAAVIGILCLCTLMVRYCVPKSAGKGSDSAQTRSRVMCAAFAAMGLALGGVELCPAASLPGGFLRGFDRDHCVECVTFDRICLNGTEVTEDFRRAVEKNDFVK